MIPTITKRVIDLRLAPADQLEVVMQRRHLEDALPGQLKEATWMMTESASTTKTPPTMSSSSSCLMRIATVPSAPPSARDPDVAHEDVGRVRVVPEEAQARADQRAAEDRQLAGGREAHQQQVLGENR